MSAATLFYPQLYRQTRPSVKPFLAALEALEKAGTLNPKHTFDAGAKVLIEQYQLAGIDIARPGSDVRRFTAEVQALLCYGEWVHHGSALYQFDPVLTEALRESALGDVALSDLQFPFRAAYFHFGEQPGLTLQTGAPITGAYLIHAEQYSLRIVLTAPLPETAAWPDRFVEQYDLRIHAKYFSMDIETAIDSALADDVQDLRNAADTLRQRNARAAQPAPYETVEAGLQAVDQFIALHEAHREAYRRCVQLIVNGLCYVTAFPVDVRKRWQAGTPEKMRLKAETAAPKEAGRARSKLNALGYQQVRYIGEEFQQASAMPTEPGHMAAHWRRGHWRRQAHGPQLALRRLTWIQPTRVLGGVLDETPRVYDVPAPRACAQTRK